VAWQNEGRLAAKEFLFMAKVFLSGDVKFSKRKKCPFLCNHLLQEPISTYMLRQALLVQQAQLGYRSGPPLS